MNGSMGASIEPFRKIGEIGLKNMRTKAIIIKKQPTNEYDQLITCYTEEFGKLTAVAKSILKPNSTQALHLDNLNLVDFDLINGRATPIIATAQSERVFLNIKSNVCLLAVAQFFTDVIDKIVFDMQKDEALWDFMTGMLEKLDNKVKPETAMTFFRQHQFYMLKAMGYAPQADLDIIFQDILGKRLRSLDLLYSVLSKYRV